jgi:hypothetical protein
MEARIEVIADFEELKKLAEFFKALSAPDE